MWIYIVDNTLKTIYLELSYLLSIHILDASLSGLCTVIEATPPLSTEISTAGFSLSKHLCANSITNVFR